MTADPDIAELLAARPWLRMDAMDGLTVDGVALNSIADALGTPTWVYSAHVLRARLAALRDALDVAGVAVGLHYAVKACDHLAVLRVVAAAGAGVDVVSGGELQRARAAGVPAGRIVFSGVGKTALEIRLAIGEGIGQINVESAEEIEAISAIAVSMGQIAPVALRINPDVDAKTHEKISTGRGRDKFGIPYARAVALYTRTAELPGLRPVGLAMHIGSQIVSLAPYREAFARVAGLVRDLRGAGHKVDSVDCGGGLGVPYRNEPVVSPAGLAAVLAEAFGRLDVRLALEPGRWIAAPAGVLLASVVFEKRDGQSRFVVLDAGMNDLVRPAMYGSWHGIVPVSATDALGAVSPADVVGPVCESSDTFARGRKLPDLRPGARVAILDAGAYGSVMSSTYNARPLAAMVLIDDGRWWEIRERQDVGALWAAESVPPGLA